MGPTIQEDLAQRDLLPGTHLVDTGYVNAELLELFPNKLPGRLASKNTMEGSPGHDLLYTSGSVSRLDS